MSSHTMSAAPLTQRRNYRGADSGCRYGERCLECPWSDCIREHGPARRTWLAWREQEIRRQLDQGMRPGQIAEAHPEYGLSAAGVREAASQGGAR